MNRKSTSAAAGIAVGALAATALGAGAYMAYTQPKEMKKILKKAARGAENAVGEVDRLLRQYL